MSFFISSAMAQTGEAPAPEAGMFQFAFLIGLFVLFYFIAIRPQRKRQKEHQSMVEALKKGDEVVMTSGMLGKITNIEDNYATVKVADNVEIKFQRVAVHAILPKGTIKSAQ